MKNIINWISINATTLGWAALCITGVVLLIKNN